MSVRERLEAVSRWCARRPVLTLAVVAINGWNRLNIAARTVPGGYVAGSLAKLEAVRPGMSQSQVREILGSPTRIYPGLSYTVHGTNYQTGGQWTYERALTFGYINVLFDTNGTVEYGHYETF